MTDPALPTAVVEARICTALSTIRATFAGSLEPGQTGTIGHQTRRPFAPTPVPVHVLDVRRDATRRLAGWSRYVILARVLRGGSLLAWDVPALTHWLTVHAEWLSTDGYGLMAMGDLEDSAHALAAISTPVEVGSTLLGSCPLTSATDGSATPCGGQVRAVANTGTCQRCGTTGYTPWWEHHMFPEASRLVTARQLVREIHQQRGQRVRESTINTWLNRGVITSTGLDEQGRRLYDKGAVAKALASAECA